MPIDETQRSDPDVRVEVRGHYARIASEFSGQDSASCCGPAETGTVNIVSQLYETSEIDGLPSDVTGLSLGCGDPVTLASLKEGQVVLDLGSGGGIDCFLAAKQVGAAGKVIGVDMTPEMIDKARANKGKLAADNVEFRLGEIEHLPVSDGEVDVVISNCVINLSPDKPQVFREAFRALRPGGQLSVSDIVTNGPLPEMPKDDAEAWSSCVSGALDAQDYIAAIKRAGFVDIELAPVQLDKDLFEQVVGVSEIPEGQQALAVNLETGSAKLIDLGDEIIDASKPPIFSAKVTARKPT